MKKEQTLSVKPVVSELEGAILGEIGQAGEITAYAVMKAFASSPSNELSASKGAIYPAIARLTAEGLIEAREVSGDKRGAQKLRLTARGRKQRLAWVCDEGTAVGAGLDPFRSRAGHWNDLSSAERSRLFARLEKALAARLAFLQENRKEMKGTPDELRLELEISLQKTRLAFLKRNLS